MSDMINVVICDGKYAIIQDESGSTNVLRYGEGWRNVTGDNVILGAAYEIDKLREHIKRLEEAYSATEAVRTISGCWCNHDPDTWTRCSTCCDKIKRYHAAKANLNRTEEAKEVK